MADAQRTIELVFQGVDKTAAATQAALNNTNKFAQNLQSATQPIADFTGLAVKLEAGLLAAGVAITAFSVKAAGDFDTAFREIATLIDEPIEGLGEFRDAILDYSTSSTQPLEEITKSIYSAISAGVDYADSIEAVTVAERLAVAGKADLNDTLTVLVSSLNAYGLGMDQAGRFSDALFQTVRSGQTTLPELGASLANVTGLAATAGVDFEELLAAISTLTATGTPTAQAITQIQGAISAILKPTSQAQSLAKELGLEFNIQRLQAVGLSGILGDVAKATGGNAEQMAILFGRVEALNGVLTLTGLGADKFASDLEAMFNSAGAVEAAFEKMTASIELSNQRISNALNGLFISIGAPLLDEYSGIADGIAAVFSTIAKSVRDGDLGELSSYIEQTFADIEAVLQQVAQNLPAALGQADLSGFTDGLDAIKGAFSELLGGVDLTTVDGLTRAIELAGNAFNLLSQYVGGVITSFGPLFRYMADLASDFSQINPDIAKAAGELGGFATQANILSGAVVSALPALEALTAMFAVNQAGSLVSGFAAAATALGGQTGLLALLGKTGLVAAAGAAGFAVGTLANETAELVTGTSISTWITDTLIDFGLLDDEATNIIDSINDVTGSVKTLSNTPIEISDGMEGAAKGAKELETASGGAVKSLIELANAGEDISALSNIYDITTGEVIGYAEGVESAAKATESLTRAGESAGGTFSVVSNEFSKVTEAAGGLQDAVNSLSLEEKIALIESQTAISVAQIEADTERMKAAFESVNTSIDTSRDSLDSLFGLLGDTNISKLDKLDIEKQIQRENDRLDESLRLQERLTEATIREINARTKALASGQPLITVNGDGLQPHLEAIMFSLLEEIQLRTNAQGLSLLLGVGS